MRYSKRWTVNAEYFILDSVPKFNEAVQCVSWREVSSLKKEKQDYADYCCTKCWEENTKNVWKCASQPKVRAL